MANSRLQALFAEQAEDTTSVESQQEEQQQNDAVETDISVEMIELEVANEEQAILLNELEEEALSVEVANAVSDIEELEAIAATLEDYAGIAQEALTNDGGLTRAGAATLHRATGEIANQLNLGSEMMPSVESFGAAGERAVKTEVACEGIKEIAKKVRDAGAAAIEKMVNAIKKFVNNVVQAYKMLDMMVAAGKFDKAFNAASEEVQKSTQEIKVPAKKAAILEVNGAEGVEAIHTKGEALAKDVVSAYDATAKAVMDATGVLTSKDALTEEKAKELLEAAAKPVVDLIGDGLVVGGKSFTTNAKDIDGDYTKFAVKKSAVEAKDGEVTIKVNFSDFNKTLQAAAPKVDDARKKFADIAQKSSNSGKEAILKAVRGTEAGEDAKLRVATAKKLVGMLDNPLVSIYSAVLSAAQASMATSKKALAEASKAAKGEKKDDQAAEA